MDISKLKHDPKYITANLIATTDRQIVTQKGCSIYIPSRYVDKNIALLGNDTYILGIYGIVMDGRWAFSCSACMLKIDPLGQTRVQIGDYEYIEFEFLPGSTLIANTEVVREDTLLYSLFDYFIDGGKIPWYLPYEDYGTMFDNAGYFTGKTLGAHPAIMQMIVSITARNPKDRVQYYRQLMRHANDLGLPVSYVPYQSVLFGPKTTTARLMGANFDPGLVSAFNNPTESTEKLETLMRV